MTGPGTLETRVLRVGFLTLLFVSIGGMGLGFVSLFFVESGRASEWLSRGALTMLVGFLTATGGLTTTLALQKGKLVWLMRAVIVLVAVNAVWWSVFAWTASEQLPEAVLERLLRVGGTLATVTIAAVLASQLLVFETDRAPLRWAGRVLAGNVVLLAAGTLVLYWTTAWMRFVEVVGAISTIWGLGTLAALVGLWVLVRMQSSRRPTAESVSLEFRLRLTCPHCHSEQALPAGLARCGNCRKVLRIEVEEPRCACGYLLFRLEGDLCPECGLTIPEAQRWAQRRRGTARGRVP
jgi:hypothetical protein